MARFVTVSSARLLVPVGVFFIATLQAQVTNVTDIEATPSPGVGHNYMRALSETVNPANGSLSVRIQVPVPKGRRLTLPFAFAYDTSGQYLPFATSNGGMTWGSNNNQYLTLGGWTYTVPTVSFIPHNKQEQSTVTTWIALILQDSYLLKATERGMPCVWRHGTTSEFAKKCRMPQLTTSQVLTTS